MYVYTSVRRKIDINEQRLNTAYFHHFQMTKTFAKNKQILRSLLFWSIMRTAMREQWWCDVYMLMSESGQLGMWPPRVLLTAVTAGLSIVCVCVCMRLIGLRVSVLRKETRIMDALSHIYPLSGSFSLNPSSPALPPLVSTSPPAHSDTCQEEDLTVMFLKGALCMNYCSFLVGPTGCQSSGSGLV